MSQSLPDLNDQIVITDKNCFAVGGSGNIFLGTWNNPSGGSIQVAIKVFRAPHLENKRVFKRRLDREMRIWAKLEHRNILPLLGLYNDETIAPSSALVSPYRADRDMTDFLKKVQNANKDEMIQGIISGLQYLHSNDIIHGDMKPQNIIIHRDYETIIPQLGDFGGARELVHESGDITTLRFTPRYAAPEVLLDDESHNSMLTKGADIYSLGMIFLYIISGEVPFPEIKNDDKLLFYVIEGLRPKRESYLENLFNDNLWDVMVRCWSEHSKRPTIEAVSASLANKSLSFPVPFPPHKIPTNVAQNHKSSADFKFQSNIPILDDKIYYTEKQPFAVGSYGELYRANLKHHDGECIEVAVKAFRGAHFDSGTDRDKLIRRFNRELRIWSDLNHPNILKLIGVVANPRFPGAVVSMYRPNQDAANFIELRPECDRMSIIKGVAEALSYLHNRDVVHGQLQARNVLIHEEDAKIVPELAGFGRSRVIFRKGDTTATNFMSRFLAPEIILADTEDTTAYTKVGDIYSFGMFMLEILTGKLPLYHIRSYPIFISRICQGERPSRDKYPSSHITYHLWRLMEKCWSVEPYQRGTIEEILLLLREA